MSAVENILIRFAVAYARTSSTSNPKHSIENQIAVIKEYCDKHNIVLVKIFIDEAKTGTTVTNREGYQTFKRFIGDNDIDLVLVAYSDRLGREGFEFIRSLSEIKKKEIEFISVSEKINGSELSPIQLGFTAVRIEFENILRKQRLSEAIQTEIKKGRCMNQPSYGYTKDNNGFLIVVKEQAAVVKEIFDSYIHLQSSVKVAAHLNESGYSKPNGSPWDSSFVYKILRNKNYTGNQYRKSKLQESFSKKRIYLDDELLTEVGHQAIIEMKTFTKVQEILDKKSKTRIVRFNLLAKVLYCPSCNSIMYGDFRKQKYVCKERREHKSQCPDLHKDYIEPKVLTFLKSRELKNVEINEHQGTNSVINRQDLLEQKKELEFKFATLKISDKQFNNEMKKVISKLNRLNKQKNFVVTIDNDDSFTSLIERGEFEEVSEKMKKEKIKITLNENEEIIEINKNV
ncbi:recombinase family protein [Bacillus sp. JJ1562]|uniref:recombinase family protein n=1 Tax=Bacillus sp. JJ1562 TaxID=3122960 RepID=UPI003002EDF5